MVQSLADTVDAFDQRALIAQISATLLGFVAVFTVLANQDSPFAESDKHFIQAFVVSGSYAIFLSLVPGLLSYWLSGDTLWRVSLGFAAMLGTVATLFQACAIENGTGGSFKNSLVVASCGMGHGSYLDSTDCFGTV